MIAEDTLHTLFRRDPVESEEHFEAVMKEQDNLVVFAFLNGELASCAWVNNVADNYGFAHYWFAKKFWGKPSKEIAKTILDYWFSWVNEDKQLLDVILGITSITNRRARAFNRRLGFTEIGEIPKMSEGVVLSFLENPNG
jgi:RimJ/RimL family protein N-acetyltransferase